MLNVFKCCNDAILPAYGTESSACFDLHACLLEGIDVKRRGLTNKEFDLLVKSDRTIFVRPGDRVLVPTGLIFDIPANHSVRIHPRSGLAYKNGIALGNCEGVIDEDYVNPVFISVINFSGETFSIKHGDRIAQAELVLDNRCAIYERSSPPPKKTNRSGGFGSTGV